MLQRMTPLEVSVLALDTTVRGPAQRQPPRKASASAQRAAAKKAVQRTDPAGREVSS